MKNKLLISIILMSILIYQGYQYYSSTYTNKGILNNVIQRNGYYLDIITKRMPIEIFIKPEWIADNSSGERKELNVNILEINNTYINLDHVWDRGNDISFSFHPTFNMNGKGGDFLYNGIFNEDGTFTTFSGSDDFVIYDLNKNKIDVGQTGIGPNSDFSFCIESQNYPLIKEGFYVRYSGFNLYEYSKK